MVMLTTQLKRFPVESSATDLNYQTSLPSAVSVIKPNLDALLSRRFDEVSDADKVLLVRCFRQIVLDDSIFREHCDELECFRAERPEKLIGIEAEPMDVIALAKNPDAGLHYPDTLAVVLLSKDALQHARKTVLDTNPDWAVEATLSNILTAGASRALACLAESRGHFDDYDSR